MHPFVCDPDKPVPKLKGELEGWRPQLRGAKAGTGSGAAIKVKTKVEYPTKIWMIPTFWVMAGMTVHASFGLEFATNPKCVGIWWPLLQAHYARGGHAPILAALKRVAADLIGADHPHVAALNALQKEASRKGQDKALKAEKIEELRDVTRADAAIDNWQIWDAPAIIDASSQRKRLTPADRDSRRACALATDIVLSTVSITPSHLARFNLKEDVDTKGENWTVRCTDHNGLVSWRPIQKAARDRIVALKRFREDIGRPSPWLFPARGGETAQTRQVAMTALARHLSVALRREMTFTNLTDAALVNMVDRGTTDTVVLGAVAGTVSRTIRRRLGIALDTPLPPPEEEAA